MISIVNYEELEQRIIEYEKMFPNTALHAEDVYDALKAHTDEDSRGTVFGFSVSPEWEDKCYTFEMVTFSGDDSVFKFLGMYKC